MAEVIEVSPSGERVLRFNQPIDARLNELGVMPLPPYIHAPLHDPERYQTIYSHTPGSAAAPTAGLHFTPRLLDATARARHSHDLCHAARRTGYVQAGRDGRRGSSITSTPNTWK